MIRYCLVMFAFLPFGLAVVPHAGAQSSGASESGPGVVATEGHPPGNGTFLNGTRMVTDSKICLASVDRCAMVRMMHLPPRIQMEAGIGALDVECGQGFQLVLKALDASPACVTPSTASDLVARGWALGQGEFANIRAAFDDRGQ